MKRLNLLAVAIFASAAVYAAPADTAKGKKVAETVCLACHTADGNSTISSYPKVAGQHAAYIAAETKKIKEGKRTSGSSAVMAAVVQNLSDEDIRNVAAYYSTTTPKSGEANPKKDLDLGRKIYRAGLADKKIPACMSCHSPNGSGMPAGGTEVNAYPRLGGQHANYVADQLKIYAQGKRTSPNSMMEDIAKRLNEDEINAVSNYIQGLH